jgi:oxygen-independent coproporphyrinogen-3 oxidase
MTAAKPPQSAVSASSEASPDGAKTSTDAADPTAIGVYVHFPWCLKKCPYCDFLSVASPAPDLPHGRYADAVLAELERRARELGARRLRSVFFGGGTPSLWDPAEVARVLSAIFRVFGAAAAPPEVTLECNPTSFDPARAEAFGGAGVNRFSIGVQGLEANRLQFLGRLHDPAGALRAVRDAVASSVERVSADLIFGVAGEPPEVAASEAATLADLGLTHVSAYALTIEPGTQFGALARKGKLPLLDEGRVAESFEAVDAALAARGFEHYEISNYARAGAYAEHNLGYWRGLEYLGLGCGAWGTVDFGAQRVRYRNTPVPERYLASAQHWADAALLDAGPGELVSVVEPLDPETLLRERILLGLRLAEGLDIDEHAAELGVEAWPKERKRAAQRLLERGRIVQQGTRWMVPKDQWLFADGTISALL